MTLLRLGAPRAWSCPHLGDVGVQILAVQSRLQRGEPGARRALPTTVVVDRREIVRWLSLADNYRVRPDPAEVTRAVRALALQ